MAKKTISLNLNEETIQKIDNLAEKMNVSRSYLCEETLKTAIGENSLHDFTKWLFSRLDEGKEEEKNHLVTAQ